MKFGMINLPIILLRICDFHENRQRDGRTFLIGVTKITPMCTVKTTDFFKVKNALLKAQHWGKD
jgi:hypothetical protein